MTASAPNHRIKLDVMRLIANKFDVTTSTSNIHSLSVKFPGPPETPYEGGVWKVRVHLPENYPFKSPSVGFDTQIFHPNIDQTSGTICLDVLNQKWTALYDLVLVFGTFLPQLLRHPNPQDPLNHCAAMVLIRMPERYKHVVAKHVLEFATPPATPPIEINKWNGKETREDNDQDDCSTNSEHESTTTGVSDLSDND